MYNETGNRDLRSGHEPEVIAGSRESVFESSESVGENDSAAKHERDAADQFWLGVAANTVLIRTWGVFGIIVLLRQCLASGWIALGFIGARVIFPVAPSPLRDVVPIA